MVFRNVSPYCQRRVCIVSLMHCMYINGTLIYANIVTGAHELNNKVSSAAGTKFRSYCNINRDFNVHNVYSTYIPEQLRIAFTRVRLSSHRLRIETGRWARIPPEHRLCECGTVQDEEHVLVRCPLTEPLRRRYGKSVTFPDIIDSANCEDDFRFIQDVMSCYNWVNVMYLIVCFGPKGQ